MRGLTKEPNEKEVVAAHEKQAVSELRALHTKEKEQHRAALDEVKAQLAQRATQLANERHARNRCGQESETRRAMLRHVTK